MSVSKPIDDICRKLANGDEPDNHHKLIRVDKTGEILTGFSSRFKTVHRFAVRNDYRVKAGISIVRVGDFVADEHLDIPIRWAAHLVQDGAALIRESVKTNLSIQHTIEHAMQQVLQAEAEKRGNVALGSWAHGNNRALTAIVTATLKTLSLEAICILETDKFISASMEIKTPSFPVRTQDSDREISVNIDMRIDPLPSKGQSGPKSKVDWDLQIRAWTKDYVERNETLNDVYLDSRFDRRLEDHINEKLCLHGWTIQRFTLKTPRMVQEESLSDIFHVNWTSVKGQTFKFDVKLAIVIQDLGLYDKMGKPGLKSFAQEVLDKSFEAVLFKRDTDSLSPDNFKEVREDVHSIVNQTAARYGIGLTTLVPDPTIPEWELLKPKIYDFEPRDYETSDPGSKANFKINLEGYISSIGAAFSATSVVGSTVEKQIEKIATDKAAIIMREVEISDYFAHFHEAPEDKQPVKERLEHAIKEELKNRFAFEAKHIFIHQNDPNMRKDLRILENDVVKQTHLKVMPDMPQEFVGDDYLVPVAIQWRFDKPSRSNAVKLNYRQLKLDELAESVPAKMKNILDGLPHDELSARTFEGKKVLKKLLYEELSADLGSQGVGIHIESVIPSLSESEKLEYWRNKGHIVEDMKIEKSLQANRNAKLLQFDTETMAIEASYETYQALIKRRNQQIEQHGQVEYEIEQKIKEFEQRFAQRQLGNHGPEAAARPSDDPQPRHNPKANISGFSED
ncbi:hypothetical protein EXT47_12855 [Pseudoalteromonas sp. CO342X]|uniref:hypothetical protein n=1 Tax=Pseudoalteromonas sp. CO342X TaxID=1777270 RepID=UPI001023B317|nr:hypothetical protein [Pseudoalteromonas sp. CO342X]RZG14791.1 hypothetical protein EXT47_12855 [Pseudoalteromonas sp. CO342X]